MKHQPDDVWTGDYTAKEVIDGHMAAWSNLMRAAQLIDPYEMRDGQLVRKSDGKPVTI